MGDPLDIELDGVSLVLACRQHCRRSRGITIEKVQQGADGRQDSEARVCRSARDGGHVVMGAVTLEETEVSREQLIQPGIVTNRRRDADASCSRPIAERFTDEDVADGLACQSLPNEVLE